MDDIRESRISSRTNAKQSGRVGLDECRTRLAQQKITLLPSHLQPVTPPQFLTRMLANIHALAEDRDPPLAAKMDAWFAALAAARQPPR